MQQTFIQALTHQRGPAWVPAKTPFTACAHARSVIPAAASRATSAAVCGMPHEEEHRARPLTEAEFAAVESDLSAHLRPSMTPPSTMSPSLTLYQDNGELISWDYDEFSTSWIRQTGNNTYERWQPSTAVKPLMQKIVADLAAGSPSPDDSSSPSATSAAPKNPCDRVGPTQASGKPLAEGAQRLWLCSLSEFGPPEPLTGAGSAALMSAARSADQKPCADELRNDMVVAQYSDGHLELQLVPSAGCDAPPSTMTAFVTQLTQQRTNDPASMSTMPVHDKHCHNALESVMPMTLTMSPSCGSAGSPTASTPRPNRPECRGRSRSRQS